MCYVSREIHATQCCCTGCTNFGYRFYIGSGSIFLQYCTVCNALTVTSWSAVTEYLYFSTTASFSCACYAFVKLFQSRFTAGTNTF